MLGIGLATGQGVSVALLVAIFVSNLPEAIGSATDMKAAGRPARRIVLGWTVVALVCAAATVGGHQLQEFAGNDLRGGIDGFGTPQYAWMVRNAGRFGFVHPDWAQKSGQNPEPWHWEFGALA